MDDQVRALVIFIVEFTYVDTIEVVGMSSGFEASKVVETKNGEDYALYSLTRRRRTMDPLRRWRFQREWV